MARLRKTMEQRAASARSRAASVSGGIPAPDPKRFIVYGLAAAMFILHQDFWFWTDRSLVWGMMPVGLAYHMGFSICTAILWFMAVHWAWPHDIEAFACPVSLEGIFTDEVTDFAGSFRVFP